MPIMAAQDKNDARSAARLLARIAKEAIANPDLAPGRAVALNNVYRLLEAYRANPFFGSDQSQEETAQAAAGKLTLGVPKERYIGEVRAALESAVSATFESRSKQQAIEIIERVLRSVAYPSDEGEKPSSEDRQRAVRFFDTLHKQLNIA